MIGERFFRVEHDGVTEVVVNHDQMFREYTALDGQIASNIELASKAMQSGSFEKATAYALIAQALQTERANLVRLAKGGGWLS